MANVPDWKEISGYFTETDIDHMGKRGLDLKDCKTVLANAEEIYRQVATHKMPKNAPPWSEEKINGFHSWWKNSENHCG